MSVSRALYAEMSRVTPLRGFALFLQLSRGNSNKLRQIEVLVQGTTKVKTSDLQVKKLA